MRVSRPPSVRSILREILHLLALGVVCLLALWSPAASAAPSQNPTTGAPARPGVSNCQYRLPAHRPWSVQERWAWQQICLGNIADLSTRPRNQNAGGTAQAACDPREADGWPPSRALSSDFLVTLLRHEPYRSATGDRLHIRCARFDDALDLSDMTIAVRLRLEQSRFRKEVDVHALVSSSSLSFNDSVFDGGLVAYQLDVRGQLFLERVTIMSSSQGPYAYVAPDLVGSSVGQDLSPSQVSGADVALYLVGASVGQDLNLKGAKLFGEFSGDRLQLGGSLFMEDAFFETVTLTGARVTGNIVVEGDDAEVKTVLKSDRLSVEGSLFMRQGATFSAVNLQLARIGGHLQLHGGRFCGPFDLSGTRITGELRLSAGGLDQDDKAVTIRPSWSRSARLILRNTYASVLNDSAEAWENLEDLDLDGFTYDRFGGLEAAQGNTMADQSADWIQTNWLSKHPSINEVFVPQPFEQVAEVLRASGRPDTANQIMVRLRDYERTSPGTGRLRWVQLWLERMTVGYGYNNWWAMLEFVLLVGVGTIWRIDAAPGGGRMRLWEKFWYSLDRAIPVITLDHRHGDIWLPMPVRGYFYVHQIVGFVLTTFLVAGLSGLLD